MTNSLLSCECNYLAKQVLAQGGSASSDVVDTLANKFLKIAEARLDFVRQNRDSDEVVAHIVRYLADVHAIPPMGTDTRWFSEAFDVLLALAVPNSGLTSEAAQLMPSLQDGIRQSLATVPVDRNQLRVEAEDAIAIEQMKEAGTQFWLVSSLLDLLERVYHGDQLGEDGSRLMRNAALAAPLTRHVRGE